MSKSTTNWTSRISDVMVRVLALSAVDYGFGPRWNQTRDNKIGICYFSAKSIIHSIKEKEQILIGSESG